MHQSLASCQALWALLLGGQGKGSPPPRTHAGHCKSQANRYMLFNTGEFAYKTGMEKCKGFSFFRITFENIQSSGHEASKPGLFA